jgi:hypothetical protein
VLLVSRHTVSRSVRSVAGNRAATTAADRQKTLLWLCGKRGNRGKNSDGQTCRLFRTLRKYRYGLTCIQSTTEAAAYNRSCSSGCHGFNPCYSSQPSGTVFRCRRELAPRRVKARAKPLAPEVWQEPPRCHWRLASAPDK